MTATMNTLKIKMDGQEHELERYEIDEANNAVYLDLDETITVQVDDVRKLFAKDLEILRVGFDDDFISAKIDTFYVDGENKNNQILGISF